MEQQHNGTSKRTITRRNFLEQVFTATVVSAVAPSVVFSKSTPRITLKGNSFSGSYEIDTNFVFPLQAVGGSVRLIVSEISPTFRIIVTRVSEDHFEAVFAKCPHKGFKIKAREGENDYLECEAHDSRFQFDGTLIPGFGPADDNLKRYETSYDGESIVTIEIDELAGVATSETEDSYVTLHSTGPLSNQVVFKFSIEKPAHLTLTLWSLDGKEVLRPLDAYQEAGSHYLPCDLSSLDNGLYLYRLTKPTGVIGTGKLTVTE